MAPNVFKWKMSAASDKSVVDRLRQDIINAVEHGQDMDVKHIIDLLPLKTDQSVEIAARGKIRFSCDASNKNKHDRTCRFNNEAQDDLWIEFQDPVRRTFSATIPAKWSGTVKIAGDQLEIAFDKPIKVKIPELAKKGVGRSMFQLYERLHVSPSFAVSLFKDASNPQDETDVDVSLINGAIIPATFKRTSFSVLTFADMGDGCGSDPNDKDWYVVWDSRHNYCFVAHGAKFNNYTYSPLFGPNTKAECDAWASQHCAMAPGT